MVEGLENGSLYSQNDLVRTGQGTLTAQTRVTHPSELRSSEILHARIADAPEAIRNRLRQISLKQTDAPEGSCANTVSDNTVVKVVQGNSMAEIDEAFIARIYPAQVRYNVEKLLGYDNGAFRDNGFFEIHNLWNPNGTKGLYGIVKPTVLDRKYGFNNPLDVITALEAINHYSEGRISRFIMPEQFKSNFNHLGNIEVFGGSFILQFLGLDDEKVNNYATLLLDRGNASIQSDGQGGYSLNYFSRKRQMERVAGREILEDGSDLLELSVNDYLSSEGSRHIESLVSSAYPINIFDDAVPRVNHGDRDQLALLKNRQQVLGLLHMSTPPGVEQRLREKTPMYWDRARQTLLVLPDIAADGRNIRIGCVEKIEPVLEELTDRLTVPLGPQSLEQLAPYINAKIITPLNHRDL